MKLQHVTPESVGVPSQAVLDLLDEFYRQGVEMHGLMLLRHGQVYAEGHWAPYNAQTPHILFSFSKSLTSTAIGFAVQEGILSLEDKLVDLFPDKVPENPSENLQACCVRDLLMMACGHAKEIDWVASSSDWVSQFLEDPFVYQPGTHFLYNTAGTNMLSAIITRKTGLTLTQFLQPRLFDPLEMGQVFCQPLADGTEMGGAGMYLTLEAMARFTQFVANKGRWEGKQLLNAAWFEEATAKHIENLGPGWDGDPDWHAGYCYQFWRCDKPGIFRGDGAYGQYGIVLEPQDAVVVIQGCTVQLQKVLNAVWDKLLPALGQEPLPQDSHGFHRLQKRLERLELNPMLGTRNPGAEASLDGAVYLPDAPTPGLLDLVDGGGHYVPAGHTLESLGFSFQGGKAALVFHQDNGALELPVGLEGHFLSASPGGHRAGGQRPLAQPQHLRGGSAQHPHGLRPANAFPVCGGQAHRVRRHHFAGQRRPGREVPGARHLHTAGGRGQHQNQDVLGAVIFQQTARRAWKTRPPFLPQKRKALPAFAVWAFLRGCPRRQEMSQRFLRFY